MTDWIPYGRQSIGEEDIAAVAEVMRSDYLTTGPTVDAFEHALAIKTGAPHAVAVSSGTAALHAMYFAAGVRPGDEIITSPLTFAATANAAVYLGATVRFADVDRTTGNLDPASVEERIGPRTRAVIAVDYAGQPADYDALRDVIGSRPIVLLADAAHSLGATYDGRTVGTLADASALSFHPVKLITTGEGGAVLTSNGHLARRASRFRTHGVTREAQDMDGAAEGPWYYEQIDLGFNYRLTDLQAALGLSQLQRLDEFVTRRRAIAAQYHTAFAGIDALELPQVRSGVESAWHLYVVMVREASRRRAFYDRLRDLHLGVQVHYIPVYRHPFYRGLGHAPSPCPVADDRYERSVSLPMFPGMTDAMVDATVERVRRAAAETL